MRTFKKFFEQKESKSLTTAFGRFNPPTIGHEKLINAVEAVASGGDFKIYASQSQDKLKNPLKYDDKINFMREMFSEYENNIVSDINIKTIFDILTQAYNDGYTQFTLVVGSDRVPAFDELIKKYNGVEGKHGFYDFVDGLEVVSAGERDPDSEGVEGMSASKMREAASKDDFQEFIKGLPVGFALSQELFDAVKEGMALPSDEELGAYRAVRHK
tara:strand:+ start:855 stop:1499 length:645 start_codon:yes stop_codon:yes gene_type:complete